MTSEIVCHYCAMAQDSKPATRRIDDLYATPGHTSRFTRLVCARHEGQAMADCAAWKTEQGLQEARRMGAKL